MHAKSAPAALPPMTLRCHYLGSASSVGALTTKVTTRLQRLHHSSKRDYGRGLVRSWKNAKMFRMIYKISLLSLKFFKLVWPLKVIDPSQKSVTLWQYRKLEYCPSNGGARRSCSAKPSTLNFVNRR